MTNSSPQPPNWLIHIQQVLTIVFLLYVLILLGRSGWQNIESTRRLTALRDEIATLRLKNNYLQNLIIYQQTDSFRELEARQKLGLKKPGELVINLPDEPLPAPALSDKDVQPTAAKLSIQLWWEHFFH